MGQVEMKLRTLLTSTKLWLLAWIGVLLVACQGQSLFFGENAPMLSPRTILDTNIPVDEAWRVSSLLVFSIRSGGPAQVLLKPDRIVTINYQKGGGFGSKLVSFSTSNGEIEWETFYGGTASSLIADQDRVYVASAGRDVEAYSLQTGELFWSGMDLPDRRRYDLDVQGGILLNYQKATGETEEIVYAYDTNTGETLQKYTEVIDAYYSALVMWLGQFALYQTLDELYKVDRDTKEIMWRDPIENDPGYNGSRHFGIKQFPILSDNKLIVVSGRID
ncbi:MAG: PQQ-binding-like beta-propeller repeat protein, partial [Gammaproteobacteria bacterium]|nr:PQQ-binding-like beta-propeller repeat protein [Gammaproteobacteria bacterium]